jgi:mannonate dehydratase
MKLAMCLEPEFGPKWVYAKQMGIDYAVILGPADNRLPLWDFKTLVQLKSRFEDAGLVPLVIEGLVPMDNIRLATPERDRELEQLAMVIRNMGALGIPVFCYSWMAIVSWLRSSTTTRARGGALTMSYDHSIMRRAPAPKPLRITETELWDTFRYFLERIVPVAEKANVRLALHPDDPPLSPVMGVARIFGNLEAFDRALAMIDSEANGITFCQANFGLIGGPGKIPDMIRHFGKRIHFVHFRDVRGTAESFVETFHDEGHTDMFAAMLAYREIGFDGAIRPDHAPSMEGEPNINPGYEALGRLFAVGYMKGLLEGVEAVRKRASA